MDPLAVNALGPARLSALGPPRPVQPLAIPAPPDSSGSESTALSTQDLAQVLFQRTLQAAILFPVTEGPPRTTALVQNATASLLAALSAPQAGEKATASPGAAPNPVAAPATDTPTTTPAATTTPTVPGDLPAAQDAFATGSSLDFALQTALRFGAGVAPLAGPPVPNPDLATGLVRDAASIPRLRNLQPHAGAPGPEVFAPPPPVHRILRQYLAIPAAQGSPGLDLMA